MADFGVKISPVLDVSGAGTNDFKRQLSKFLEEQEAKIQIKTQGVNKTGDAIADALGKLGEFSSSISDAAKNMSSFGEAISYLDTIASKLSEIKEIVDQINLKDFSQTIINNGGIDSQSVQTIQVYGEQARALNEYMIRLRDSFVDVTNASRGANGVLLNYTDQFVKMQTFEPDKIAKALTAPDINISGIANITGQLREYLDAFMTLVNALGTKDIEVPLPDDSRLRAASDAVKELEERGKEMKDTFSNNEPIKTEGPISREQIDEIVQVLGNVIVKLEEMSTLMREISGVRLFDEAHPEDGIVTVFDDLLERATRLSTVLPRMEEALNSVSRTTRDMSSSASNSEDSLEKIQSISTSILEATSQLNNVDFSTMVSSVDKAKEYLESLEETARAAALAMMETRDSAKYISEAAEVVPLIPQMVGQIDDRIIQLGNHLTSIANAFKDIQLANLQAQLQQLDIEAQKVRKTITDGIIDNMSVSVAVGVDEDSLNASYDRIQSVLSKPVNVKVDAEASGNGDVLQDASKKIQEELDRKGYRVVLTVDQLKLLPDVEEKIRHLLDGPGGLLSSIDRKPISFDPFVVKQIDAYADALNRVGKQSSVTFQELRRISEYGVGSRSFRLFDGLTIRDSEQLAKNIERVRAEIIEMNKAGKSRFDIESFDNVTSEMLKAAKQFEEAEQNLKNAYGKDSFMNLSSANQQEAVRRAASNVRGLTDELQALVTTVNDVKDASKGVSEALTFKFDEASLSSLSETIQDAISKAASNIKLTIDNVEISIKARQKLAKNLADQMASGTKSPTGETVGSSTQAIQENADATEHAAAAKEKDAHAAMEAAEANEELASSERKVAEAAEEAAQAEADAAGGPPPDDDDQLERLIKLYVDLNNAYRDYENERAKGNDAAMYRIQEDTIDPLEREIAEIEEANPELIELAQNHERVRKAMEGFGAAADNAAKKENDRIFKQMSASAEEAEKALDDLQKKMSGLTLDNPKIGKLAGNEAFNADYSTALNEARAAIVALQNADTASRESAVANARQKVEALDEVVTAYQNAAKSARELDSVQQRASKLTDRIDLYLQKNGKLSASSVEELNKLRNSLNGLDMKGIQNAEKKFQSFERRIKIAGEAGQSFFQQMKAGWYKFGGWSLVSRSFMSVIRIFKQAVTAVKEVDAAMTELRKVTDLTTAGYREFYEVATGMAGEVGAKLSDIINSTADFARLGYNITEAAELSRAAMTYMNVGDSIENVSEATESIISTIKAFNIEASRSMEIVDKFNEVGN